MEITYIECDNCDNKTQINPSTYSLPHFRWISLNRTMSQSGDLVMSGNYTFCSDKCLVEFLKSKGMK